MDTLISNVTVVTMNPRMDVLFGAYIAIEDGKILSIEKTAPKEQPQTIIDGTGMVAIPGLINCHTHLATAMLRSSSSLFDPAAGKCDDTPSGSLSRRFRRPVPHRHDRHHHNRPYG